MWKRVAFVDVSNVVSPFCDSVCELDVFLRNYQPHDDGVGIEVDEAFMAAYRKRFSSKIPAYIVEGSHEDFAEFCRKCDEALANFKDQNDIPNRGFLLIPQKGGYSRRIVTDLQSRDYFTNLEEQKELTETLYSWGK